jgi:hypothetical protein
MVSLAFIALTLPTLAYALIDRQGVVSQFNVVRTSLIDNETTPLQVGNGNFAFNVDNTGMQVGISRWSCHATVADRFLIRPSCHSTPCRVGLGITTLCLQMGKFV